MKLSLIIPNYNNSVLLSKNLPHVLRAVEDYSDNSTEIIIPDDLASSESQMVIAQFKKFANEKKIDVKTIINKSNNLAGFSKNVNRGIGLASGDILILLNTDVSPSKNFLKSLLRHFINKNIFAVACMDQSLDNNRIVLRGRGIGKWSRGFLIHSRGEIDRDNTLWASGGSSAFNKKIWDKIGGLEELYDPFYWEDIDLSYRALKCGYNIVFEKNSTVEHDHDSGVIKSMFTSEIIKQIAYRNQFIFVWINITDKNLLISHFVWLPYHLTTALMRGDFSFHIGFLKALLILIPILKKRRTYSKNFIKEDMEIIKNFAS
jgi:GT2 family glycosyltransferase